MWEVAEDTSFMETGFRPEFGNLLQDFICRKNPLRKAPSATLSVKKCLLYYQVPTSPTPCWGVEGGGDGGIGTGAGAGAKATHRFVYFNIKSTSVGGKFAWHWPGKLVDETNPQHARVGGQVGAFPALPLLQASSIYRSKNHL